MQYVKYFWTALLGIIETGIALAVLDSSSYGSNHTIVAGLIIIYATIRALALNLGYLFGKTAVAMASEMLDLRKRIDNLNNGVDDDSLTDQEVDLIEARGKVVVVNIQLAIRSFFVAIILIIGLVAILG